MVDRAERDLAPSPSGHRIWTFKRCQGLIAFALDHDIRSAVKAHLARGLLIASAMGFVAVAGAAGSAPDSAGLEAAVLGLIGDATCERDEQCRTLAFGAKACGGPQSYLAWSTLRTDEAVLKAAAVKFTAERRAFAARPCVSWA